MSSEVNWLPSASFSHKKLALAAHPSCYKEAPSPWRRHVEVFWPTVHKITGSPRMTSSGHFIIFIISININSLIMLNYAERIIEAGFTEKISNSD